VVEGHADERGSKEYNMALGDRRAQSVKSAMIDAGIAADRIETVSFGEDKPAQVGHNESAWSMNRRVEFNYENNTRVE
jgi:peptidoglycan-associated lipoprotein